VAAHIDIDIIRSRFIQENLRRALLERDREQAIRALRAFRLYFQWFETDVPEVEKPSIIGQLASLEEACAADSSQKSSSRITGH
jgi:hypothetical protein